MTGRIGRNVWLGGRVSFWPRLALEAWRTWLHFEAPATAGFGVTIGGSRLPDRPVVGFHREGAHARDPGSRSGPPYASFLRRLRPGRVRRRVSLGRERVQPAALRRRVEHRGRVVLTIRELSLPPGSARAASGIRHSRAAGAYAARTGNVARPLHKRAGVHPAISDRRLGVRWARWTTRRRAPILWSALLAAIVAAPIAARLPLRGDMSYLLPPQTLSVRDLHTLEARAQVFGTIIVAIESEDAARRSAAARLVRDRLAALPAGAVIGVSADSAAKDRFAWEHRHLLAPTADLTAIRDELAAAQGAPQSAVRVAGRRRGRRRRRTVRRWAIACVTCKGSWTPAKAGAAHPTPLVSKDGRLQIVVVRTRFAAGEVSRNAPVLAAVEGAADEARRARRAPACGIGVTGDVVDHRGRAAGAAGRHAAVDRVHGRDRRDRDAAVLSRRARPSARCSARSRWARW